MRRPADHAAADQPGRAARPERRRRLHRGPLGQHGDVLQRARGARRRARAQRQPGPRRAARSRRRSKGRRRSPNLHAGDRIELRAHGSTVAITTTHRRRRARRGHAGRAGATAPIRSRSRLLAGHADRRRVRARHVAARRASPFILAEVCPASGELPPGWVPRSRWTTSAPACRSPRRRRSRTPRRWTTRTCTARASSPGPTVNQAAPPVALSYGPQGAAPAGRHRQRELAPPARR